jgi:hypothetical protein
VAKKMPKRNWWKAEAGARLNYKLQRRSPHASKSQWVLQKFVISFSSSKSQFLNPKHDQILKKQKIKTNSAYFALISFALEFVFWDLVLTSVVLLC